MPRDSENDPFAPKSNGIAERLFAKPEKWFGRIVYEGEGIEMERSFKTKAEAEAYKAGFDDAQEVVTNGDSDVLEEYFACVSDEESVDE